jgi:hypothetical protein
LLFLLGDEPNWWPIRLAVPVLLFLLGAIRMYQARRGAHWVRMAWGFGLLLLGVVCGEALVSGFLEINYFPGMESYSSYAYDLPIVSWWEPYAWWGLQAATLCGKGLIGLGFFGAAREMVRGKLFNASGKRKGGRA